MSDYTAYFDGHDLSTLFTLGRPERRLVGWEPTLIDRPSAVGALYAGTKAQSVEVTMQLVTLDNTDVGRQFALRTLAGWLAVDEPKPLVLTDEVVPWGNGTAGVFRNAVPKGEPTIKPAINADVVSVTFICTDPLLYLGDGFGTSLVSHNISSSQITFTVRGTAPTYPNFNLEDVRGDSNGVFRMFVVSSDRTVYNRITFSADPNPSEQFDVSIYCSIRSARTPDNARVPLTLDSGWPRLSGGQSITLTIEKGSVANISNVSYTPTWW